MSRLHHVPTLIVTGTVGVGKTTVASEISDILSDREVPHAFVDIDAISTSWPPQGPFNQHMAMKHLASIWQNFRGAGAERLVLACVVESEEDVEAYEEAVPGAKI